MDHPRRTCICPSKVPEQATVSYRAAIERRVARAKIEDLKGFIQLKDSFSLADLGASVCSELVDRMIQIKDLFSRPLLSFSNSLRHAVAPPRAERVECHCLDPRQ